MALAAGIWLRGQRLKAQQPSAAPGTSQQSQVTGTPGSPSGTTTINGEQLPPPPPKFEGVIKETYQDSTPWWPPRVFFTCASVVTGSTSPAITRIALFGAYHVS